MIPLRDTIPSRRVPIVNYAIITTNVLVFLYEVSLGPALPRFIYVYGLVPVAPDALTMVTSMFLHGSWFHLLGNMLYLYIFGDNVEDRLGHFRYLVFYVLCGVFAALAHLVVNLGSPMPVVGASGAIAGVSGAYFLFFPTSRIVTLVPILIFIQVVEIPAVFFLLIWFMFQLFSGVTALGAGAVVGGVAWWAHVGGFLAGMVLGPALAQDRHRRRPAVWIEW